jgi:hypothetical protein
MMNLKTAFDVLKVHLYFDRLVLSEAEGLSTNDF